MRRTPRHSLQLRLATATLLAIQRALGRMLKDEQVQPVIEHLYGSVTPSIVELQQKIGISLDDLTNLAVNEIAVGLVGMPSDRPALVVVAQMSDSFRRSTKP